MIFSSAEFLFLFLPCTLLLYYNPFFRGRGFRNVLLLLVSIFFYAWGEKVYVLLLMGYVFIYHKLGKIEYGADDLLSTVTRLRRFKRNYMIVNTAAWILAIGLMCFIFPAIYNTFRAPERGIAAITFMCVAIFAGICIQYFIDQGVRPGTAATPVPDPNTLLDELGYVK